MASIFYSRNDQGQRCHICYSDEKTDLEEKGPIANHLVGKHEGAHASCVAQCFRETNNWRCALCHIPLNPYSSQLTRGVRRGQSARDLIKGASHKLATDMFSKMVPLSSGALVGIALGLICINVINYFNNRPLLDKLDVMHFLSYGLKIFLAFVYLPVALINTASVIKDVYKRIAAMSPPPQPALQ